MALHQRRGGIVVPIAMRNHAGQSILPRLKFAPALKPPVGGLVVLDQPGVTSIAAMDNGINHIMFRLLWNDIEPNDTVPTLGHPTYDWTVVNNALDALNGFPGGAYAKIGVGVQGPGLAAPQWLRDATGSVTVTNTKDGTSATCCHWWEAFPQARWAMLQNAMAAQFDSDQRLKQVIACLHMANYMEPFILGSDSQSDHDLWNAGLESVVSSATSISTMLDNTLSAWKQTRVELPLHTTWEVPKGAGTFINQQAWPVLRDFINPYEQAHGPKIMFSDYGLGSGDTIPNTPGATMLNATTEYEWMRIRGFSGNGPVGFQITDPGNPNTQGVVANADLMNGCYLEHSGYGGLFPTAQAMTDADRLLKDNAGLP